MFQLFKTFSVLRIKYMYSILGIVSDFFSPNMIMMTINCLVYKKTRDTYRNYSHITFYENIH